MEPNEPKKEEKNLRKCKKCGTMKLILLGGTECARCLFLPSKEEKQIINAPTPEEGNKTSCCDTPINQKTRSCSHCDRPIEVSKVAHRSIQEEKKCKWGGCKGIGCDVCSSPQEEKKCKGCSCGCGGNNKYCDMNHCSKECRAYNNSDGSYNDFSSTNKEEKTCDCNKYHHNKCPLFMENEDNVSSPQEVQDWEEEKSLKSHSIQMLEKSFPGLTNYDKEDWEEEFEKYFAWVLASGLHGIHLMKPVEDFIKSLLARQREEMVEKIEANKLEVPKGMEYGVTYEGTWNEALDDIITLIKE